MKKLFIALALSVGTLLAQQRTFKSTLTTSGTTTGQWVDSGVHTVQVVITGSPSACTVRLEGSLDFTNWFDLSGTQNCTSNVQFSVGGPRFETYARVNLLTFSGGTSPTATITYRGSN